MEHTPPHKVLNQPPPLEDYSLFERTRLARGGGGAFGDQRIETARAPEGGERVMAGVRLAHIGEGRETALPGAFRTSRSAMKCCRVAIFSAAGFRVQRPCGPRKSGI